MRQYFWKCSWRWKSTEIYPGEVVSDASVLCMLSRWPDPSSFCTFGGFVSYVTGLLKSRVTACASGITWSLSKNCPLMKFILGKLWRKLKGTCEACYWETKTGLFWAARVLKSSWTFFLQACSKQISKAACQECTSSICSESSTSAVLNRGPWGQTCFRAKQAWP